MIISAKNKYVFVAIPKTGTRSIYAVLNNDYAGKLFKEHYHIIPQKHKNYFKFTVTRNPYDRAVSLWWSTCKRGMDKRGFIRDSGSNEFEDFLLFLNRKERDIRLPGNNLLRTQAYYLNVEKFDKILNFENLSDEFKTLPFLKKDTTLPIINTTLNTKKTIIPHKQIKRNFGWEHYMTPKVIKLINKYYAEDFELLPQYQKL